MVRILILGLLFAVATRAADLPRVPARSADDSRKAFVVAPGLRVELVVAEPLVQSPMACEFDENGRLWVVELPEYNDYAATRPQGKGRIVVLDDTDGDGKYDKRTVFADNLNYPTGLFCYNGGVYVGTAPELLYLKDTNGDGKADDRKVILTGFGKDKAGEGQLNSFRWTLDNRILISTGLDGGEVDLGGKEGKKRSLRAMNVLLDPATNRVELTSGGGQHGMTLDDFGRAYVSGNSDPIHTIAYDARYIIAADGVQAPPAAVNILPSGKFTKLNRLSEIEPWRIMRTQLRKDGKIPGSDEGGAPAGFFTGATGVTVYRGNALPAEYRGDIFVGEVANNLIFRAKVKQKGSLPVAERADAEREFLASKDVWFRPVQLANGPDGAMYVLDMYRELIEGAAFLAPEVLKNVDPSAGFDKGRIWRIVPESFTRPPLPALGKLTPLELVPYLDHENGWHRDTAARLLYQRRPLSVTVQEQLIALASKAKTPQGRVHALHAAAPLAGARDDVLRKALADPHPRVREHALRLAENSNAAVVRKLDSRDVWELRRDPDINVRIQLAYSMQHIRTASTAEDRRTREESAVFVQLAFRDGGDPWMRLAVLAGMRPEHQAAVLQDLATSRLFPSTPEGHALVLALAERVAAVELEQNGQILFNVITFVARQNGALARALLTIAKTRGSTAVQRTFEDPNWEPAFKNLLDTLMRDVITSSRDRRFPPERRVPAIRDLTILPFRESTPIFEELLQANQPPAVQIAALETLAKIGDDGAPRLMLAAWASMTPSVRATATEVWLSRNNWVPAFLDAVEERKIARADVDPTRVAILKKSPARNISVRATKLFAAPADRQKVFDEYRKALDMKGDPVKGKLVFKNHCSACHKLDGVGEEVGADLKGLRDRGLENVLLNVIDPNREVKPQYLAYQVELKSGRQIAGMLIGETVTGFGVRQADGRTVDVRRTDVETMRSLGMSYMPEGLEKQIDLQAMADLLAYINSIKP